MNASINGNGDYPSAPDSSTSPAETSSDDQPAAPKPPGYLKRFWRRNGVRLLFTLTLFTTLTIGFKSIVSFSSSHIIPPSEGFGDYLSVLLYPPFLFPTLAYTAALLGFLASHEMGHYFMCKFYGIDASLPYFLPNPVIFGTFGAVIRIRSPIRNKRALFDIGIAGPLAGFAVALPILIFGMAYSEVIPIGQIESDGSYWILGEPLLQKAVSWLMFLGTADFDLVMSPLAMVGWFGCLVTAINLLPVSQLDGGHILYSIFGKRHFYVSLAVIVTMVTLALTTNYYGWLVWAVLILILGLRHPPLANEAVALDGKRHILAAVAFIICVICFIPVPITIPEFEHWDSSPDAPVEEMEMQTEGQPEIYALDLSTSSWTRDKILISS